MEITPDTIINELFNTLDGKALSVPDSDCTSISSMAESNKKSKHEKSKKHKKHKKKSKKSKKKKRRSRSNSHEDYIELKLKKDKLEEVKSGMPVTLDVVMDTILTEANEKSKEVKNNECDKKENSHSEETCMDEIKVDTSNNQSETSNIFGYTFYVEKIVLI